MLVTYLWRGGDDTRNVVAETPFDTGDPAECQMTRLPGTDVWYRSFRAPSDLRASYCLSPNDPLTPWSTPVPWAQRVASWRPDPLNPRRRLTFPEDDEAPPGDARGAAWAHSTLELPAARTDPWSVRQVGTPAGRVELHRVRSERLLACHWLAPPLRATRRVWVYTPPGYATAEATYPLVVLFDGYDYLHYVGAPTILDNLIADRRIPPLVAVLLDTPNEVRGRELLRCSPRFTEALARDVLPWVRGRYRVARAPSRTVVGGFSAGGVGAAFSGFRRPDLFGNVLTQSGAFWWNPDDDAEHEWLARQFAATPRRPLRFYVDVGRHETWAPPGRPNQLLANRHLRTVLRAKGYPVRYAEFAGGHSFFCWQATLADGLQALLGTDTGHA